jgi:hypothetical protein
MERPRILALEGKPAKRGVLGDLRQGMRGNGHDGILGGKLSERLGVVVGSEEPPPALDKNIIARLRRRR